MPFLMNSWYAAGWAAELEEAAVARTFLGEHVVLFRNADGKPSALRDACPHRFAPLSRGRIKDGVIACGYHGLEFNSSGQCVRNPHGQGVITGALKVRSFPLAQKYGMLWIWMGDEQLADERLLPDFPILGDAAFTWVHGRLVVDANYELIIDNLLDLTHVEFLHPFLGSPGSSERTQFKVEQHADDVLVHYVADNEPVTALFELFWEEQEKSAIVRADMHWKIPSNLVLETSMSLPNAEAARVPRFPTGHLLTPETEDSTHYFWVAGRNRQRESEEVSGMISAGVQHAFESEDEPMIRAVRSRMQSNDLFAHRPALLPIDEAAVRARRLLAKRIETEQASSKLAG